MIRVCLYALLWSAAGFADFWPLHAAAQGAPSPEDTFRVFTLETSVQQAIGWHPSIDRAVSMLAASGQGIREARSGYYPQISGGVGPGLTVVGGPTWRPRATLSASQLLYDFGGVRSNVAAARAGENVSRAELLMAVDNLARDTSYAVIELQRYRVLLKVAEEQLESLNAIASLVQLRVARGASARSDGTQAEARIQAAEATILEIRAELLRWQSNLQHLTGQQGEVDVTEGVPSWLYGACLMETPDLERVPSIMQSHAMRDRAEAAYHAARAGSLPRVSFDVDMDTDMRDPLKERNDVRVGVKISSSLYQGGGQKARERAAFHDLQAAEAALAAAQVEIRQSFSEARQQISTLKQRIGTLDSRKTNMQETRTLYRLQYFDLGTRTLLDLLNAEQELHQIRFEEVNAEHDMRRLSMSCLHLNGTIRDAFGITGTVLRGVTL